MTDSIRPDREAHLVEQMTQALSDAGAFCGECGFEPGDKGCPDCRSHWERCIEKLLPVVREVVAADARRALEDVGNEVACIAVPDNYSGLAWRAFHNGLQYASNAAHARAAAVPSLAREQDEDQQTA